MDASPTDDACAEDETRRTSELPREIWGEIATFSSRDTVLNLRAVCHMLKIESDQSITRISVRGGARLRAFADANAFPLVQTLGLIKCGDADLAYLGAALRRHPRPQLCLVLDQGNSGITARGFAALHTVSFRSLQMKFGVLDTADVQALSTLNCPMSITAYCSPAGLLAMANIRGLRELWPIRSIFDDRVARAFRDHPVTDLTLVSCRYVTASTLQHIAGNQSLRVLNLDSTDAAFDVDAARAFAENQTLKTLAIWHPMHHFLSENACAALSENRGLKVLSMPVPAGIGYLGRMASLRGLHLQGLTEGALQAAPAIREHDAHALVRGLKLESLRLTRVQFLGDAHAVLLGGIRATTLCLTETTLDAGAVSALLTNRNVTDLELIAVEIDSTDAIALASHPSLICLSIKTLNDELDLRFSPEVIQALRAAWQASGRSPLQLGGVLALA